jgi:peptide/nickel transport system substrate-binding protein
MESVATPDPQTLVVHWKSPYGLGDEGAGLEPVARHLFEELYRNDIESVSTSRYLSTEYVGLGAYRLVRWEQGSLMEFAGFEDYFLGRPHFDRIVVRFVPDVNALVANILSETIDVILPDTVDVETSLEIRRRWEGTGNQVRLDTASQFQQIELQHRPEYSKPVNGLTNRTVRQAFYHAVDRKTLSEVMTQGFAPVADSWYRPNHPLRRDVENSIPQFPYDVNRAQQLLAEAGWTRGPDGVLVYGPTGDRFETEILHRSGPGFEKEASIVADNWKTVGAVIGLVPLTQQLSSDRQYQATRPGVYITMPTGEGFYDKRTHSSQIARAETRWTGTNRAGYSNPRVDEILDKIAVAIDPRDQIPLHRQLLQEQMTDIAVMPLYWLVSPILMLKGIRGPQMAYNVPNFNMWEWDRD